MIPNQDPSRRNKLKPACMQLCAAAFAIAIGSAGAGAAECTTPDYQHASQLLIRVTDTSRDCESRLLDESLPLARRCEGCSSAVAASRTFIHWTKRHAHCRPALDPAVFNTIAALQSDVHGVCRQLRTRQLAPSRQVDVRRNTANNQAD